MSNQQSTGGGIRVELRATGGFPDRGPENIVPRPLPNDNPANVKTLTDLALSDISLDDFPVVQEWRRKLFDPEGIPEICDELPRLLTEYLRSDEAREQAPYIRRAKALQHVFANKTPIVQATDLLPGQTSTSFVGPLVHVDTIGYCIWPELKTVAKRKPNPFKIRPEVAEQLNREIFPFWLEQKPVQEVARYSDYDTDDFAEDRDPVAGDAIDPPLKKKAGETPKCQELLERVAFYLVDKATCVSHTVPDFDRILKYGMNGLMARMRQDMDRLGDGPQTTFLKGVTSVFEGAVTYASRLAEAAEACGNTELARICRKVPAEPSETLHEALTAVWICYQLLLQENTNFGFSIGNLDRVLNRFYLSDWEKLAGDEERNAYIRRAVEMICHFFLHCCDHVPLSTEGAEILFAGSGSNQALTVGGTRYENGQTVDAVNDMSYIILKATELLAVRDPNVHVRYHKAVHNRDAAGNTLPPGNYNSFLRRICQVNILTRATPAFHGDTAVIRSMANYYSAFDGVDREKALADAHEYCSIGCIEENASARHYGNTGSILFVLPAVLELAIYGGKHRSDGVDADAPNLIQGTRENTTSPLTRMRSMDEFIEAFHFQLDALACQAVQCNNYLGRSFRKVRPSPLLSGMFIGPTNLPDGDDTASFRDLSAGGAKYNSAGVAVIGLADVIDSFCAIDHLVFGGRITAEEMLRAMDDNFEGHDDILELIRHAPKYGAGVDQTPGGTFNNEMAVRYTHCLTSMIQEVFYKYRTHRGGRYLAGYWSMTNHAGFGMLAKATPNGRRNSEPFAGGITPCPGIAKRNGDPVMILDHMLSVTEVDSETVQNGYTYNLSLTTRDRSQFDKDTELFSRYLKTFADNEGVLVQMCVSSIDDLVAADKAATAANQVDAGSEEEAALAPFKDLMIRVAGYSAYFVTMSPQMRQEIIRRANFALDTGTEQHSVAAL